MYRLIPHDNADSYPSRPHFTESNIISANLFCGLDWQRIARGAVVDRKDQDAYDLAFQIQYWGSCLAALRGDICPNKGRAEILIQIFKIESPDHPERWGYRKIHRIANHNHR